MKKSIMKQVIHQVFGLFYMEFRYNGKYPDKDNFHGAVAYSLPFIGGWAVINGGVVKQTSHSWEIATQRYAYDFVILDGEGKSFTGEGTVLSDFYCYGKEILAPADGVIVEAEDGNPESAIALDGKIINNARDIRGNYLLIHHSDSEFSLLAHLKPDSIRVSVGDSVKRGQILAQCGNSGNSTEPHLHFHLQKGRSFFSSPGLPVSFENITVELFSDSEEGIQNLSLYPPYISRGQIVKNINER